MLNRLDDRWKPWSPDTTEPWNRTRVAHLVRRTGFGVTLSELDQIVSGGFDQAIENLIRCEGAEEYDLQMAGMERTLASQQEPAALASWWLLRMINSPTPFLEKLTFFWHGHFATGAEKVASSKAMLDQNRLLRTHAKGNFRSLVQGISRDVAMLIYLDSTENRKTRPNENYARELMELFCLGTGNYTERDIKELARCFTGWEVRHNQFSFNQYQHDVGTKWFLEHSGNFGGEEAVNIVVDQPATSRFIARKLIRFYCTDEEVEESVVEPLAECLRNSDFEIEPALQMLFKSRFFWSNEVVGRKVRSPVELAVGLIRLLGTQTNMNDLREQLRSLGQLPLYPPNVKGWEGGRRWVNASTFVERINLVQRLVTDSAGSPEAAALVNGLVGREGEAGFWKAFVDVIFSVEPPDDSKELLSEMISTPGTRQQRLETVFTYAASLPEFHLC
ncbi:MAG: DUF1800 domain-containing protein [Pirellulaceae bacterium]